MGFYIYIKNSPKLFSNPAEKGLSFLTLGHIRSSSLVKRGILPHVNAEYIIRNARLDESQAGIKIARRNINNL